MVWGTQWRQLVWWPLLGTPRVCVFLFHPRCSLCASLNFYFLTLCALFFIFLIAERWVFAFFKINSEQRDEGHRIFILCGDDERPRPTSTRNFKNKPLTGNGHFFRFLDVNTSRSIIIHRGPTSNHNTNFIEADPYYMYIYLLYMYIYIYIPTF